MWDRASSGVPFSEIDQACAASEDAFGPFNGETTLELAGRLDVARLDAAVRRAARRHFICMARRWSAGPWLPRHVWIPAETSTVDGDVLIPSRASTRQARRAEHEAFLGEFIPITRAPPFRLLLSRRDDGDVLTLVSSHVATDGLGALTLLRTIAAEYAGRPLEAVGVDYADGRELLATLGAEGPEERQRRWQAMRRLSREVWPGGTTHVAASPGERGVGSGVHYHRIPWASPRRRSPDGPTVNDVLLVALLRAIEEHNVGRGVASRRMSILVPLNLRPARWIDQPMGNFSVVGLVVSHARDRLDPPSFLAAVAAQSRTLRADRVSSSMLGVMRTSAAFPICVQDTITRVGYACEELTPTAILSNLGRLQHAPDFGPGREIRGLWVSPPCRSPCALGVGVVFHAGQIHLSLRYRREALCHADVETIARRMSVEATELARFR